MDVLTKEQRRLNMRRIRAKNTKPEMRVRRGLHAAGFRYKLHDQSLPGKPDIVFPKYKCVIFVNGCFWHGHECALFRWPKENKSFWEKKIRGNKFRDRINEVKLESLGWRIIVIWECAFKGRQKYSDEEFLSEVASLIKSDSSFSEIKGR